MTYEKVICFGELFNKFNCNYHFFKKVILYNLLNKVIGGDDNRQCKLFCLMLQCRRRSVRRTGQRKEDGYLGAPKCKN